MNRPLNIGMWVLFGLGLLLATAPVWQRAVYGFNPTFDQLLQLALCRTDR
jgi:hypothetical protein